MKTGDKTGSATDAKTDATGAKTDATGAKTDATGAKTAVKTGPEPPLLDEVERRVLCAKKYRRVDPGLVRDLGRRELEKGRRGKEAVKAVKDRLHQIGGAFTRGPLRYAPWLARAEAAVASGEDPWPVCQELMGLHASTRERLPYLEDIYRLIYGGLPPGGTVLDLGCGLNPLGLFWLREAAPGAVWGYDIFSDLTEFLNAMFRVLGLDGRFAVQDLSKGPPRQPADLALLLKLLPTLEQVPGFDSAGFLRAVPADRLAISFPARTLGGRDKNLAAGYRTRFEAVLRGLGWSFALTEFPTEILFQVQRPRAAPGSAPGSAPGAAGP